MCNDIKFTYFLYCKWVDIELMESAYYYFIFYFMITTCNQINEMEVIYETLLF